MDEIKRKALELRKRGLTYTEIQQELGIRISKSTLSYWFKDIQLTDMQNQRIAGLMRDNLEIARQEALKSNKKINRARIETSAQLAREFVGRLSSREAKLSLAMLYLGEGGKYPGTRGLYLGSSEPRIINLYIHLLVRCYKIRLEDLKCSVYHRADQNLSELTKFWSKTTGIPVQNFYPSKPDPRTVNKPTKKINYKGVAHIYHKGTNWQLELDHVADAMLDATSP